MPMPLVGPALAGSAQAAALAAGLAAAGGEPVRTAAFPPWPYFADDEIAAVVAVLRSGRVNYWTGDEGRAFEREFAAAVGADHAVALANGTVALELALRAAGVGPGDEVVVPARTFMGTASAAVAVGAVPVVADVDAESQALTAATVRPVLTARTRAIVPVHLAGWPAAMPELIGTRGGTRAGRHRGLRAGARRGARRAAGRVVRARRRPGRSARTRSSRPAARAAWSPRTTRRSGGPSGSTRTTARASRRSTNATTRRGSAGCTTRSAPTAG